MLDCFIQPFRPREVRSSSKLKFKEKRNSIFSKKIIIKQFLLTERSTSRTCK